MARIKSILPSDILKDIEKGSLPILETSLEKYTKMKKEEEKILAQMMAMSEDVDFISKEIRRIQLEKGAIGAGQALLPQEKKDLKKEGFKKRRF